MGKSHDWAVLADIYVTIMKQSRGKNSGDPAKLMQIGAAAESAGVSRQSLQYYLMVGLLEPTEVRASGRRFFNQECITRIKLIKGLSDSGYPLRAIREVFLEGRNVSKGSKP